MAIVVITGTSTGIGLATAITLARAGHDVFATMRNPKNSPELQSIAAKENLPITILPLDVDEDASVAQAFDRIISARGKIDILINNAGTCPLESVESLPIAGFQQTMNTNFFGALRCIQSVLPGMRERKNGCIINISSVGGRIAIPGMSAYCASKFALEAMSEVLAAEVKAHNIRVVIVQPGTIDTPIFDKFGGHSPDGPYPQSRRQRALFAALLKNAGSPFFVGELIRDIIAGNSQQLRYLASPDAEGFMAWRNSLSDEEFLQFGAMDNDSWCEYVRTNIGVDVRPFL